MSTIYWKFKNTKSEFSSITFDSTHVSILDLKRAIIKQKQLQQTPQRPFDLSIINAHTGVEYTDETGPIPRNLAVIVRRLPAARNQHKKLWAPLQNNSVIATADNISKKQMITISERLNNEFGPALFNDANHNSSHSHSASNSNSNANPNSNWPALNNNKEVNAVETETMNIIDMMNRRMNNSTTTTNTAGGARNNHMNRMNNRHHSHNMHHMNGSNQNGKDPKQSYRSQRGDPPPGYICHRCHVSGHWIQDCPTNGDPKFDKKNRSQTSRSQLPVPKPATPTNISGDNTTTNIPTQQVIVGQKCYQIPTNVYDSFNGDHSKIKAYIEISSGINNFTQQNASQASGIHSRYKCEICDNYYVDARFTPCCRVTYCNECIRQKSLAQNPSMIKCPSCEEIFGSEALDTAQNTKLQEKVDKIVAQQAEQAANSNNIISSASITVTANTAESSAVTANAAHSAKPILTSAPKTIQIPTPHTIHIPQAPIIPKIRPTVILQQSPPTNVQRIATPMVPSVAVAAPPASAVAAPAPAPAPAPVVMAIDTTRFEAPKNTLSSGNNLNYICIECNERGHKYKDCPKVAEKRENAATAESEPPNTSDDPMVSIKSLKDEGLDRIPKKTPNDIKNDNKTQTLTANQPYRNNGKSKAIGFINHTPHVQLINNSALNTLNAINSVNSLNSINMMNMRNRMTVNNILMNAALHNVSRRAGGIAPRLINSHNNPLLNPALAISRMPAARNGALALLQQQSLLTQQAAALNRLRSNNYHATVNPSIHAIAPSQNNMNRNNNESRSNMSNIPQHVLDATINELKHVMSSQDTAAVTNAINAAFIKLGAMDPESKRLVLEQLVKTCSNSTKQQHQSRPPQPAQQQPKLEAVDVSMEDSAPQNQLDYNKKSKKKHKKSKSKRSKKKKHKDKSSKDRKHRHSKRKRERERIRSKSKSKSNSRSRSRDRNSKHESENDEYNTNSTDFPDPEDEDENNVIHINTQSANDKKRKLPPAPIPDFPPTHSPKHKKTKNSTLHLTNSTKLKSMHSFVSFSYYLFI